MKNLLIVFALTLVTSCAMTGSQVDAYAADRAAIIDLQHRYILAMDYFDADGYAEVFAVDGVLDWAGGVVEGREAIREFMSTGTYDLRTMGFQPAQTPDGREWPSTVRHLITNQVVVVEGDTAKAVTYWMNYANNADRHQIQWLSFGSWEDEFVKADGKWLFSLHRIFNEGNARTFTAGQPNPLREFLAPD
ncbi:MAG: nuclear transport factor 2 family protein [Pseudomonadales bacterium]|nr:nuclear transport factor 2 family protein [Pseudomonadales bacterium]